MVSSTNCCGFFTGSSRNKTWSSRVKIAVFAPIPNAKVTAATAANPPPPPPAPPDTQNTTPEAAQRPLPSRQPRGTPRPPHKSGSPPTPAQGIPPPAGETVSGAKPPRFTRASVDQALAALKNRIKQSNKDPRIPYRITDAVAFGDVLLPDLARVQSAHVGIPLARRRASSS